uniref:Uncharacterized protein n=1 Tax=Ciona intestinalis TaxID=7719 RepID=H2XJV2_CIOIN
APAPFDCPHACASLGQTRLVYGRECVAVLTKWAPIYIHELLIREASFLSLRWYLLLLTAAADALVSFSQGHNGQVTVMRT